MTVPSDDHSNGEHGVEHQVVPVMTITVDPRTWLPSYKCTTMPIAFWQMMVGEVARQLEEQRRLAAALQMQAQMQRAAEDARVAELLKKNPRGV